MILRRHVSPLLLFLIACQETFAWVPSNRNRLHSRSSLRSSPSDVEGGRISSILKQYGYDKRLENLKLEHLPRWVEVYVNGRSTIAQLVSFQATRDCEPKPLVRFLDETENKVQTVDFGQITTIWELGVSNSFDISRVEDEICALPDVYIERKLDALYKSRVGRARSTGLTKKQVARCVGEFPENERSHAESVLRKVIKAGTGSSRLLDSATVRQDMYGTRKEPEVGVQQACAAYCLSRDANLGGRFKRWPCIFVGQKLDERDNLESLTIINGGWLVLDQSVRAGNEARRFVDRSLEKLDDSTRNPLDLVTMADERIARRLECLAMGELITSQRHENASKDSKLELDVRETLKAMGLPPNPQGAKAALMRIGRWTPDATSGRIHAWPKPILEAAAWYIEYLKRMRSKDLATIENRVNLTKWPCISVDAKRVTFRDDAVGVRPRAKTGRPMNENASKWEILLHIADASDIYTPGAIPDDTNDYLSLLRSAAENRGTSRYDLQFGPLHLLPPAVLKELSFGSRAGGNRCVTLWVYIDERDGRLLDAGVERSLVASPSKLSFLGATDVMDGKGGEDVTKERAVLLVVERNLKAWSGRRRQRSEAARKREERLSLKESVFSLLEDMHDDGSDGFIRSRGHRLVDSSLDLYAYAVSDLLKKAKAPVPRARGADASRGGRVATSPLRRFIDGQAQRQVLAVCCGYGVALTRRECKQAGRRANEARNDITNIRATRS